MFIKNEQEMGQLLFRDVSLSYPMDGKYSMPSIAHHIPETSLGSACCDLAPARESLPGLGMVSRDGKAFHQCSRNIPSSSDCTLK